MALYIWLLLGHTLVAQGHVNQLKWPTTYTVKATKMDLNKNLIVDYQIWNTETKTRIDYNGGAVKSMAISNKRKRYNKTYNIRPETFENETVHTACYYSSYKPLEDILPSPKFEYLKFIGIEDITDKTTAKLEFDYTDDDYGIRTKGTLWATYHPRTKILYLVRYESMEFNTELGYKENHEIWEYSGFSTSFSTKEVFDVDNYMDDCKKAEEVTMDSDAVTKDLVFIDPEKDDHVDHVFNKFKKKYGRSYADETEHELRRRIFQNSMRHIVATNNKNLGYKLTVNEFADRTPKEMTKYKGLRRRSAGKSGNVPFPYTQSELIELSNNLPGEYDLRLYGLVSDVKHQGSCGSCWAFGTTAAVEGALARVNGGRLLALANQALLDCAWAIDPTRTESQGLKSAKQLLHNGLRMKFFRVNYLGVYQCLPYGASGCDGGADDDAYEWMMEYGLPTVAEYGPYKSEDGICNIKNMTKKYPIRGYTNITPRSVNALKIALINHGPLTVSIHTTDSFFMYSSGIFYDPECNETSLDHEVALVGYGERNGETFWILKNSYGPNWGIDGYMYISAKDNMCGVATEPTYVLF